MSNKQYEASLTISPNVDNYQIDSPNKYVSSAEKRMYTPTVTQQQWNNCIGYTKGSSMNPSFSLDGYYENYSLSDLKNSLDKTLYFTSFEQTFTKTDIEEQKYIRSRSINYFINEAKPNDTGNILIDNIIVDIYMTDENGYTSGTFILPSGTLLNGSHTLSLESNTGETVGSAEYYARATNKIDTYTYTLLPFGVIVNGKLYGKTD